MDENAVTFENLDAKAREHVEFASVVRGVYFTEEQWKFIMIGVSAGIAVTLQAVNEEEKL